MIKISIIIPAYNAEKYIKNCINRLLQQTYKNIELIVINDASNDKTKDILNDLSDINLHVINLKTNLGAYCARKKGLQKATGDYILFVDVDDYLDDEAIEKLVNYINIYNTDIIKFRYIKEPLKKESPILFGEEKKPFLIKNKMDYKIINQLMTTNNLNNLWSMIIKKDVIKNDNIEKRFSMGEDFIQSCYIYGNANRILFIDDILYHYLDNPNGTMKNINEKVIKNNINDLLYCNTLLHDIIKKWNLEEYYYDVANARTYNAIVNILISKLYSEKKYDSKKINSILHYLFSNYDYIEYKKKIPNIKNIFLFNNERKGLKGIIFNNYKKQLYNEKINKIHIIGFVISVKNKFMKGKRS